MQARAKGRRRQARRSPFLKQWAFSEELQTSLEHEKSVSSLIKTLVKFELEKRASLGLETLLQGPSSPLWF